VGQRRLSGSRRNHFSEVFDNCCQVDFSKHSLLQLPFFQWRRQILETRHACILANCDESESDNDVVICVTESFVHDPSSPSVAQYIPTLLQMLQEMLSCHHGFECGFGIPVQFLKKMRAQPPQTVETPERHWRQCRSIMISNFRFDSRNEGLKP
jgi:hypothetical protein